MFKRKYFTFLIFVLLCATVQFAQAQKDKPYSEEITVVAAFKPEIPDAFKINQNPTIVDTTSKVPTMTFDIRPYPAQLHLGLQAIEPAKLGPEQLPVLLRNYVRAGMGNYLTTYAEFFASTLRDKDNLLSFRVKHLGANSDIKDYATAINNQQTVELAGKHFFPTHTLSGKADYNRTRVYRYGYKPDELDSLIRKTDYDSIDKQRFQRFGISADLVSNYSGDEMLNHSVGLSFYNLKDLYKVSETNFNLKANLNKLFYLFDSPMSQVLGLDLGINHYTDKIDTLSYKNTTVSLAPYLKLEYNEYFFKIGLNTFFETNEGTTSAKIYPNFEARLSLIPNALQVYLGLDGFQERNTLQNFSTENPFISTHLDWQTTYDMFRFFGGVKSNISQTVSLNASFSYRQTENMPFFITDSLAPLKNMFTPVYDNVNELAFGVELAYAQSDKLMFTLTGNFFNYKMNDLEHAWYKPDYKVGFGARYLWDDKLILKAQLTANGEVWALAPIDNTATSPLEAQKLNGWLDLSLGAEYRITKYFSAWVNLNNISNSKSNIWWNYPTYGFNALVGVSFGF